MAALLAAGQRPVFGALPALRCCSGTLPRRCGVLGVAAAEISAVAPTARATPLPTWLAAVLGRLGASVPRPEAEAEAALTSAAAAAAAAASSAPRSILSRLVCGSATSLPLLLAAAPVALPPSAWHQLAGNYVFVVGFAGWFLAQFLKIFTKWYKTGVLTPMTFFDSGGTPSSHSSLCSAITTAVALQHGVGSSLFAVATAFSVIVMYDAMGVRRHAGLQAEVLNVVVKDLLEGHPASEKKLKEVLGHTPRQVLTGAVLGVLVGIYLPWPLPLPL